MYYISYHSHKSPVVKFNFLEKFQKFQSSERRLLLAVVDLDGGST